MRAQNGERNTNWFWAPRTCIWLGSNEDINKWRYIYAGVIRDGLNPCRGRFHLSLMGKLRYSDDVYIYLVISVIFREFYSQHFSDKRAATRRRSNLSAIASVSESSSAYPCSAARYTWNVQQLQECFAKKKFRQMLSLFQFTCDHVRDVRKNFFSP